jgi:NhaP-type Na+/H+ or K+/H+ antiporter
MLPSVFGLIDLVHWGNPKVILEQGARIAIAIQVMGVALRLPRAYPFTHWHILAVLLGLLMPLMWLISGLLVYLLLGLPFWVAMLVGSVITPTDQVVSTSVVTGKVAEQNLPERIRHSISAESGANDGLAYPFVLLPILLLTNSAS